jgi:hypothetical protein
MGCLFPGRAVSARLAIRIGIFGLSEAGATSVYAALCRAFRGGEAPTGDHAAFSLGDREVTLHDAGYDWAQHTARWRPRYADLWGFVFVIDASDRGHFLQSVALLDEVRRDRRMTGKPCFVFLNKSDLADPITVGDVNRFTEMVYDVLAGSAVRATRECDPALEGAFAELIARIAKIAATLQVKVCADNELAQAEDAEEEPWEEPQEAGALGASFLLP